MSRLSLTRLVAVAGTLLLAAAGVAAVLPPTLVSAALPACHGANQVMVAPYACTATAEIDGTTFTVVLEVDAAGALTVTYSLDAPRDTATDLRVRSHAGRWSDDPAEASSVLDPGAVSVVLSVGTILCGQIDVKAVFTGNGDARGRIAAPWVTTADDCQPTTTTTTTTTTTVPTTPPSTPPSSVAAETTAWVTSAAPASTAPASVSLPRTGPPSGALAGLAVGATVAGCLLVLAAGRRRTTVS